MKKKSRKRPATLYKVLDQLGTGGFTDHAMNVLVSFLKRESGTQERRMRRYAMLKRKLSEFAKDLPDDQKYILGKFISFRESMAFYGAIRIFVGAYVAQSKMTEEDADLFRKTTTKEFLSKSTPMMIVNLKEVEEKTSPQENPFGLGVREVSHPVESQSRMKITADLPDEITGASHVYRIHVKNRDKNAITVFIPFQKGLIKDVGINGLSNEALLSVLIDRLEGYQRGPYNSSYNQSALAHLRLAREQLDARLKGNDIVEEYTKEER